MRWLFFHFMVSSGLVVAQSPTPAPKSDSPDKTAGPSEAKPKDITAASGPASASVRSPWVNSLGMRFVPVKVENNRTILFSVWETRVVDFKAYVEEAKPKLSDNMFVLTPAGWKNTMGATWEKPGHDQLPTHPVSGVTFQAAKGFCEWLSQKEGRTYRLPTDHEWSCAAGIGDKEDPKAPPIQKSNKVPDHFPWGKEWPPPQRAGNLAGEESKKDVPRDWRVITGWNDGFARTAPTGASNLNALGIADLGGNVFEWCDTGFSGPEDVFRTVRGGSWAVPERLYLLSSYRTKADPSLSVEQYGFRLVLVP